MGLCCFLLIFSFLYSFIAILKDKKQIEYFILIYMCIHLYYKYTIYSF